MPGGAGPRNLLVTVGDRTGFPTAAHLASYAGLAPTTKFSTEHCGPCPVQTQGKRPGIVWTIPYGPAFSGGTRYPGGPGHGRGTRLWPGPEAADNPGAGGRFGPWPARRHGRLCANRVRVKSRILVS